MGDGDGGDSCTAALQADWNNLETCRNSARCEGALVIDRGSDGIANGSSDVRASSKDNERQSRKDDGSECSELHSVRWCS